MEKLKILNFSKRNDTITRTIRISGKTFDKINDLAEKNNISFNSVINQIIEFGLENLEEETSLTAAASAATARPRGSR